MVKDFYFLKWGLDNILVTWFGEMSSRFDGLTTSDCWLPPKKKTSDVIHFCSRFLGWRDFRFFRFDVDLRLGNFSRQFCDNSLAG